MKSSYYGLGQNGPLAKCRPRRRHGLTGRELPIDPHPDLSFSDAADIISRAPEFHRYARLVKVARLDHVKDLTIDISGTSPNPFVLR